MTVFLRDVRHGARTWIQRPLLTMTAILTLGLGIGLNSAMFSFVDGLLLRPLPIPDIDRVAMLWESWPELGSDREPVAPANYLDWKGQNAVFAVLAWRATRDWLPSLALVAAHGAAVELYQATVPGRQASVGDFVADVVGGGLALAVLMAGSRRGSARPTLEASISA